MKNNHIFKIAASVLCMLFMTSAAYSQAAFGAKVGYVYSDVNVDVSEFDIDTKGKSDLSLGLFFELPLSQNFMIQPEFTYLGRGYKIEGNSLASDGTYNVAYVDVGAMAKLRFGDAVGFYIGAGPYFSYAISGQVKNDQNEVDIDFDVDDYRRTDFTLGTALGLEFGRRDALRFFVDGRYLIGMNDLDDGDPITFSRRNRVFGVNGGIIVPLGN
jgi:hypothetical protein